MILILQQFEYSNSMYALVKLFSGYRKLLWYHIPSHLHSIQSDDLVRVPLRNQVVTALVIKATMIVPSTPGALKDVIDKERLPFDPHYVPFMRALSYLYQIDVTYCMQRLHSFLHQKES